MTPTRPVNINCHRRCFLRGRDSRGKPVCHLPAGYVCRARHARRTRPRP
jgi:hypothetical protein